jgi:hypothetical protein
MDLDLIGLLTDPIATPAFPFPPRLDCTIELPAVTGQP